MEHSPFVRDAGNGRNHMFWYRAELSLGRVVREKVLDLCGKRYLWTVAIDHPEGHRTSSMPDRLMRDVNSYFAAGLHLHGEYSASEQHC